METTSQPSIEEDTSLITKHLEEMGRVHRTEAAELMPVVTEALILLLKKHKATAYIDWPKRDFDSLERLIEALEVGR